MIVGRDAVAGDLREDRRAALLARTPCPRARGAPRLRRGRARCDFCRRGGSFPASKPGVNRSRRRPVPKARRSRRTSTRSCLPARTSRKACPTAFVPEAQAFAMICARTRPSRTTSSASSDRLFAACNSPARTPPAGARSLRHLRAVETVPRSSSRRSSCRSPSSSGANAAILAATSRVAAIIIRLAGCSASHFRDSANSIGRTCPAVFERVLAHVECA